MARSLTGIIRNARIANKNFSGAKVGVYGREGDRNFSISLDPEQGEQMLEDGWNVKRKPGREKGDPDRYYLNIAVSFKNYPPNVWLITSGGKTPLTEETVSRLDGCMFAKVDLELRGRVWEADGGRGGVKAYLRAGYFTIDEDVFASEYGIYE